MFRLIRLWVVFITLLSGCSLFQSTPKPEITTALPVTPTQRNTATSPGKQVKTATPTTTQESLGYLQRLGGVPCPNSGYTCLNIPVPLDHFGKPGGKSLEVVFGVLPARGERKGLLVSVVGGPGVSGLAMAYAYSRSCPVPIREHFDLVFFDQRGTGLSGGIQCPQATAGWYQSFRNEYDPLAETALIKPAIDFASACVREVDNPELLSFLGSEQAVEDLESFRQAVGDEKIWLYGESYGTQFAQRYASAHPDHLGGLVLDGPQDMTFSVTDSIREQVHGLDEVLAMTLKACDANQRCLADFNRGNQPADATRAYADLAAGLAGADHDFDFPLPTGGREIRSFTAYDLETATSSYLYSESARAIFLRSLAAAARGDLVPMVRILYDALSLDPHFLTPVPDPGFSDASYYAVKCSDTQFFSGTPEERAQQYIQAGSALDAQSVYPPYFHSFFYRDLPCVSWPDSPQGSTDLAPLVASGVPVLVLHSTADPSVTTSSVRGIFQELADGSLVTIQGGSHPAFGWGMPCPDVLVTDFLVEGRAPAVRETTCQGEVIGSYFNLSPVEAAEFTTPLEALIAADIDIHYLPEHYFWDRKSPREVGCSFGGVVSFAPSQDGEIFSFENCAFSEGFVLTGKGSYNISQAVFSMDVSVTGLADGNLVYTRLPGQVTASGSYAGQPIVLKKRFFP